MLFARILQKSLGIISLIILARLLTPEDYAVIAICTFVLYLGETLSSVGSESFIVRKKNVSDEDLNTAFTLDFISKIGVWLVTVALIPVLVYLLDGYQELGLALFFSASIIFINAFKNPGIYVLNREFKYSGIFTIQVIQKVVSFIIIISLAFIYNSYWALIIGDIFFALIFVLGSYFISPYRPKFSLSGLAKQWAYSKWIMVSGIIGYLRAQLDTLVVSKLYAPVIVGRYHLIKQVSMMPASDVLGPALVPLMTSYSKVKENQEDLAYQFNLSVYVTLVFITPICLYMARYSDLIIEAALGAKWIDSAPIMSIMAIMLFSYGINQLLGPICMVKNKVKQLFIYDLLSFIFVFIALVYLLFNHLDIADFTLFRTLAAFIPVFIFLFYINRLLSISAGKMCSLQLPIIVISMITLAVIELVSDELFENAFFNLFVHVSIYFVIYASSLWLLTSLQKDVHKEVEHFHQLVKRFVIKLKNH
ncbi:oligosaccharide flippase family protein [Glaciecola petra]|uniref:Oligosaccharide flippase family protein n=1 Tax=Glaciecola petra TaxID=3075602 RepID=A0ABU2ZLV8_9ALTE|nr:oligosaccharide flippase family protein [Aestuariibacter sp. P117]MDT0593607.1 oligosaccharide flippase family protein [Aestuariibacter sp. P117]